MRDPRSHQATTNNADFLDIYWRHANRAARTLFGGLLVDEQRADHVFGLAARKQLGEIFGFDTQRSVEWQDRAFIKARQYGLDRVVIALAFFMRHCVEADEQLHRTRVHRTRTTGELEILLVPWCGHFRIGFHPSFGIGNKVCGRNDVMHQPLRFCRGWIERLALNDHHRCVLQTDEARRTLGSATAG